MRYAAAVIFKALATGQIQILRTGSGFWRWDHGAAFSIDKALLAKILRNTQLRSRPLRVDFMHWSNGDQADDLDELMKAGEVDPRQIYLAPWRDPATGAKESGLFCPVTWTGVGADAAYNGLDEISPVIEWEYVLPFTVTTPEGVTIPAGTFLGPTITGISLVDQGFFWMDKVRTYHASHGARLLASLYQESTMILTPVQLASLIAWMATEGIDDATQALVIGELTSNDADDQLIVDPAPGTLPAAADPLAAAEVMAARAAFVAACAGKKPALIASTQAAYTAAISKAKKPATPKPGGHPLAQLLAAATTARQKAATPAVAPLPAPPGATGVATYAALEEQLTAQKAITDQLMFAELNREGLLVGIDDPMELYRQAPDYFYQRVQKNVTLAGSGTPAPSGRSGLREVKAAAGDDDEDRVHRAVTAYRAEQVKAGRKDIKYEQALLEWEEKNPRPKKTQTL